jgi:hypothetical protein
MSIDAETAVQPTLVRGITRAHLVGLLINAIVGAFFFDPSRIQWAPVPAAHDMAGAILLSIFAFFGFEAGEQSRAVSSWPLAPS